VAAVLAAGAGWVASSAPDGLERVADELGFAVRNAASIVASPFADYPVGSGLVGVALLYGFGVLFGRMLRGKR
jgi:hypothetical protein